MSNGTQITTTVREQDLNSYFELLAETFECQLRECMAALKREAHNRVDLAWKAAEERLFRPDYTSQSESNERNGQSGVEPGQHDHAL